MTPRPHVHVHRLARAANLQLQPPPHHERQPLLRGSPAGARRQRQALRPEPHEADALVLGRPEVHQGGQGLALGDLAPAAQDQLAEAGGEHFRRVRLVQRALESLWR